MKVESTNVSVKWKPSEIKVTLLGDHKPSSLGQVSILKFAQVLLSLQDSNFSLIILPDSVSYNLKAEAA